MPATPAGVATSLSEVNATGPTDACGPGATCFGQISVVTVAAPAFPANDPLHLTFRIDSSELPKHFDADDLKRLPLFHDGVARRQLHRRAGRRLTGVVHLRPQADQAEALQEGPVHGRARRALDHERPLAHLIRR